MYSILACRPVFLISSYSASTPLAHWSSYLAQYSSLFGPDGAFNYDFNVTNSINCLLIGSRCLSNGTHAGHCWANLAYASKHIKNSNVDTWCNYKLQWCIVYIQYMYNLVISFLILWFIFVLDEPHLFVK